MIDLLAKGLLERLDRLSVQLDAVQDDIRRVRSSMPDLDDVEARLERIEAYVLDLSSGSVADDGSSSEGDIHE